MTEDLANLFEGKEVRIIEEDGDILFPLADLAAAWGVHRNTLPDLIDRHLPRFDGFHTTVAHVSCAGMRAVNEIGLYLLLGAVSTDRLKNPEAAEAILRFQRWAPSLIQQYRKGEINQKPDKDLQDVLQYHADVAKILIAGYGYKEEVAHSLAMAAVVEEIGDPARTYSGPARLPAAETPMAFLIGDRCTDCIMTETDPDFEKYFSRKKVAAMTGTTDDRVGNILENQGILTHANGSYHLTTFGEKIGAGKVFTHYPLAPHRMNPKKMIRYSNIAVERVRAHLSAGQTKIAETAG
jgi:hypothetical protein